MAKSDAEEIATYVSLNGESYHVGAVAGEFHINLHERETGEPVDSCEAALEVLRNRVYANGRSEELMQMTNNPGFLLGAVKAAVEHLERGI
jgi:hypothetical protein